MTVKYYWEDLAPGRVFESEPRTLSAKQMVDFALEYDPQYYHTDEQAARSSPYGGLIASGWQTVSLCMRMTCDSHLLDSASLGSPGVDKLRWIRPVRPGDSLRMRMTVLSATPSQSKPDRGTIFNRWEIFNQHDELVMVMEGYGIIARRGAKPDSTRGAA